MKSRADFDKIIDKRGKLLGVLNYNLMIPVEEHLLIKVDLKECERDSIKTKHYKQLCIDELSWCRKNAETIINKANCLYRFCTENTNYKGKSRCLDFKRLEAECNKYNNNTLAVYDHLGFKITDEQVADIGNGFVMDDYVFEYSITRKED